MAVKHVVWMLGGGRKPPWPLPAHIWPKFKPVVLEFDDPAPPGISHQLQEGHHYNQLVDGNVLPGGCVVSVMLACR